MITIESHPGKPLINHLKEVAKNCVDLVRKNLPNFTYENAILIDLLYCCGFFHDLAKSTSYFQYYLHHPDEPTTELKNHALPSAVFVFYFTGEYLKSKNIKDALLLQSLCFMVVKRHHGNLLDYFEEISLSSIENLTKQFESINAIAIQAIIDTANDKLGLKVKWQDFLEWFSENGFEKEVRLEKIRFYNLDFKKRTADKQSEVYYLFLWMFGILLYSDKSDVILEGNFPNLKPIHLDYLVEYRKENHFDKPRTEINRLKNEAYFSILETLEKEFNPYQHFYSITLPTGIGKTLTSFGVAMKMKELVFSDYESKLIIAIPFTSIIDQNNKVYQEVLKHPDNSVLLKHHHLAEPRYKEGEDSVRDSNQSQFLIETWQSSMIVTTFVQLIEVLITNNKSKLLKISSLANSIIILDEVQQINHKLWELVRLAFFNIAKHLNCYIILMSATQPLIFRPEKEIKELVPNHHKYFSFFHRTKIINKTNEEITLEDFISNVTEYADENPQKDILIILNTKKVTLETYRKIKEWNDLTEGENDLIFLTTLITPFERKQRIKQIEKRSKNRKIIVSTQLIEAGVDISVDTVFRSMAPLDSIIQAAGRANRYNEKKEISSVYLYKIEELIRGTNFIYGADLITKTENVLKGKDEILESQYLGLINEYFEEVKDLSVVTDGKYIKSIRNLKFKETGEFKLIDSGPTESVFIGLNEKAIKVWKQYVKLQENKDLNPFERKNEFSKFKSDFYDFVINVTLKHYETEIGLPFEPSYGFYFVDVKNQELPIYNIDSNKTPNREGYIFDEINAVTY